MNRRGFITALVAAPALASVAPALMHMDNLPVVPTVGWRNSIVPGGKGGEEEYLDLLLKLQEAGVPVPLRMLAAASGQDISKLL